MWKATGAALFLSLGLAVPAMAQSSPPDLAGIWACDASPMLIRGEWTTLTYTITIADQRDALFTAEMDWSLPPDNDVTGNQEGTASFSGTIKALGVIGWDNETVDMVAFGDGHRHHGAMADADTIRFVHSETGSDAWVARSICRRKAG